MMGKEYASLQDLIMSSIQACDIDIRRNLYQNIVLSGGNTMFKGISERLTKEIKSCGVAPDLKVNANPDRKFAVWTGASILTSLSSFIP